MLDSFTATAGDHDITIVTISNDVCRVVLTDLGARILELHAPDRDGVLADVVLGRKSYDELPRDPYYFGVTAGRYANRIREGRFEIDGTEYAVTRNEGQNHVHGGDLGFDTYVWSTDLGRRQRQRHVLPPVARRRGGLPRHPRRPGHLHPRRRRARDPHRGGDRSSRRS